TYTESTSTRTPHALPRHGEPVELPFKFFSISRRHTTFKCDWSSDVCSSDLNCRNTDFAGRARRVEQKLNSAQYLCQMKIGRASCRARVEISVVAVSLKH